MYYSESPSGNILVVDRPRIYATINGDKVIEIVAPIFKLFPDDLKTNRSRAAPYPDARFLCFRLMRNQLRMGLQKIADEFGIDHTTVVNGLKKCDAHYKTEPAYMAKVILAESRLNKARAKV